MKDEFANNNLRIAKNTLMLYVRMVFILIVNIYTSRIILNVLGATDYGIYNVVGGIVTMLSFITASLSSATSRYLTFELGKGEQGDATKMFRCSTTIFYIFAIISFVLAETIGLWFVQTQLNIPLERKTAAFWVYQFSIISFVLSLISVSYNALIIAKEHMSTFAYVSIYDGLLRLVILYLLNIVPFDNLIIYSGLLAVLHLSIRFIYTFYCKRNFVEASSKWLWDKNISKEIFSYAGWTVSGHLAIVSYTQGLNILLNIYFGPIVNAARAIATQVQTALAQLYANFNTAIRPQVIKNYAQGNLSQVQSLILRSARISFMLAILINIPFFTFTEYILHLWLVNPPEHTVTFVRLTLIAGISNSLSQHTIMAVQATGDIKKFVLFEGLMLQMILPISWILLFFYSISSEKVIMIYVIIEILTLFIRIYIAYPKIRIPIKDFFLYVLKPACATSLTSIIPAYFFYIKLYPHNITSFFIVLISMICIECFFIYSLGLDKSEKKMVRKYAIKKIKV